MEIERDRQAFGAILRRLRRAADLSQQELAERANISVESVSALERGRRRAPYRDTVRMLGDALQLSQEQRTELEAVAKRQRFMTKPLAKACLPDEGAVPARSKEIRGNLTRSLSTFHGRAAEVEDLLRLLEAQRLVSITGAGGIGKTRVSMEIAWSVIDRYRDGVWVVDFAPLAGRVAVARLVLATLQVPAPEGGNEIETLIHHLKARNALIVIDNCEQVIDQVAMLSQTLLQACPELRILTTTREPLHVWGESVYRLPSLDTPSMKCSLTAVASLEFASVALFADRAKSANAAFVFTDSIATDVSELCRRVDGIPLAIELAASRVMAFSPREIVDQLAIRFAAVSGSAPSPRRRTMTETIRWSYDSVSPDEQRVFREMSVFANGFTLECALGVREPTSDAESIVVEALLSLVDKSLVVSEESANGTRYRLLEPLRAFGFEQLRRSEDFDGVRRRFGAWCLSFAREAGDAWLATPSRAWSNRVEPELDNLRSCLLWALEDRRDIELGQRIVCAARRVWGRLCPTEGKRWVDLARATINDATPAELVASLALTRAHVSIALEDYRTASVAAHEVEASDASSHSDLDRAEARGFAGFAAIQLGASREGRELIEAAIATYTQFGALQLIAFGKSDLAIAYSLQGHADDARRLFRESLTIFRELQNERGASTIAANLAELEFSLGDVDAALRLCSEALVTSSSGREARICLANMAAYLIRLGRFDEARKRARESLEQTGMARADVEVALAVQHLAAVAALRERMVSNSRDDDAPRAARLIGFVDHQLNEFSIVKNFTEQSEYDTTVSALRDKLGKERFEENAVHGWAYDDRQAISEALQI